MADTKTTGTEGTTSETRGRLVKEAARRTRSDRDDSDSRPRRRRRRGVLFRGSLLEGIYQATIEGLVAASDALRNTVDNFAERDRDDRDRRGGRLGGMMSNCIDTGWDAYDGVIDIPRRSWKAYRNEIDAEDEDLDEGTDRDKT